MKKVAIVTGYDLYNYGNRLQNYAVQTVLERMGMDCQTIVPEDLIKVPLAQRAKLGVKAALCSAAPYAIAKKWPDVTRRYNIDQFNKNIKFKSVKCEQNRFPNELADRYDYFVAGSDQVWNPYFWKTTLGSDDVGFSNHLLCFARPEQRKCFAPSIGVSELPPEWNDRFREAWLSYRELGVREQEGAECIRKLTGRSDVQVMADPTLMLNEEDWRKVMRVNQARPKQDYVLYMLLGKESEEITPEKKKYLDHLTYQNHYIGLRMRIRQRPEIFASGAGEFLDLLYHAKLVVTDSFHCVVFSFLFGKPFLLFKREISKYGIDMSSRTNTLLRLLDLEHKRAENQVWDDEHIFECNYASGWENLERARRQTQSFLERSFAK